MSLATLDALIQAPGKLRRQRLREGTYEAGSHTVYFQDESTLQDAAHLYAILNQDADTGSPNLENELVLGWIQELQSGQTLGGPELAKLLELLDTYHDEIEAWRADPDESQNLMAVPDGNSARIIS